MYREAGFYVDMYTFIYNMYYGYSHKIRTL